jgi:sugar lactone lactonase YvrE
MRHFVPRFPDTCAALLASWLVLACGSPAGDASPAVSATGTPHAPAPGTVETYVERLSIGTGGIALDPNGRLYAADFGAILGDVATMGRTVRRVDADGTATVLADGLEGASGNVLDADGSLYQSNIRGNSLPRIAPAGVAATFADEGLRAPVGVAIGPDDAFYVANCGAASIARVGRDGRATEFATDALLDCPNGVTFDEQGMLYVANFDNGDVLRVDRAGTVTRLATVEGGNHGHLTHHDGALYVVARRAHRIVRVSLDGDVEVVAGTGDPGNADGPRLKASLNWPNGIAVDADGAWMYVNEVAVPSDGTRLAPTRVRRIRLR